ncbi:MAG: sodium-dependent transporter, partial [Bacteroidaceae bacterium]|nr:sodium-dependent transporter [Bacteroidaceae bacterium]
VESLHQPRARASVYVSVLSMLLGVLCVYSFGPLGDVKLFGLTFFDLFDFVSSKILLPLGGILICLFTGWYLDRRLVLDEVTNQGRLRFKLFRFYLFLIRYVVPIAIAAIFVNELF